MQKVLYAFSHRRGRGFDPLRVHHKNNHTCRCGYFYGIRGNLKCSAEVNSAPAKVSPAAKRLYGAKAPPRRAEPRPSSASFRQYKAIMGIAVVKTTAISRLTTEIPQTDSYFDQWKGTSFSEEVHFICFITPQDLSFLQISLYE